MGNHRTLHTTVGNLIVALTDAASEVLPDPRDSAVVVAALMNDLLAKRRCSGNALRGFKAEK